MLSNGIPSVFRYCLTLLQPLIASITPMLLAISTSGTAVSAKPGESHKMVRPISLYLSSFKLTGTACIYLVSDSALELMVTLYREEFVYGSSGIICSKYFPGTTSCLHMIILEPAKK